MIKLHCVAVYIFRSFGWVKVVAIILLVTFSVIIPGERGPPTTSERLIIGWIRAIDAHVRDQSLKFFGRVDKSHLFLAAVELVPLVIVLTTSFTARLVGGC